MSPAADVIVVGGGPAGLSAAIVLRRAGIERVIVLERERHAGGVPRHAHHQGFGVRDLRRLMSGPSYARRLVAQATAVGVDLRTEAMVTQWHGPDQLEITSPRGRERLRGTAVLLACGCRERPRSARLVAGSRPQGVMTTGTLQQLVHLEALRPGSRALIVGAEHVSYSAIATLRAAGSAVIGMTTELERHQSAASFALAASLVLRVPLWTRTRVSAIRGRPRVSGAELTDLRDGRSRLIGCDTVVFTADWVPEHELAVKAGMAIDPATRGPAVDQQLRTGLPGVYAAGNILHGAEPADIAAISGRHAARSIVAALATGVADWAPGSEDPNHRVPVRCEPPLDWIVPNILTASAALPPRGSFRLRSKEFLGRPSLAVEQDGRTLWAGRVRRLMPGRSTLLPASWLPAVHADGGPVQVRLR